METQKFNLCWNEFDKAASLTLKCLVEDQDFTDVTISCDDQQMQVMWMLAHFEVLPTVCSAKIMCKKANCVNNTFLLSCTGSQDSASVLKLCV